MKGDKNWIKGRLAPIMRYYTGLELFNSYSNVIFSSHIAGKEGYSPKEYFDDLYSLVWESAIKKNHPNRIVCCNVFS
ncbi:MAG: hypothetical protein ACLTTW_08205 [Coprobacter sp.]